MIPHKDGSIEIEWARLDFRSFTGALSDATPDRVTRVNLTLRSFPTTPTHSEDRYLTQLICHLNLLPAHNSIFLTMEDLSNDPPTDINPYEVLEIEITASSAEVKSSYKKLALRYHPGTPRP